MYIIFKEEVDKLVRKIELIDVYKIVNDLGMLVLKKGNIYLRCCRSWLFLVVFIIVFNIFLNFLKLVMELFDFLEEILI